MCQQGDLGQCNVSCAAQRLPNMGSSHKTLKLLLYAAQVRGCAVHLDT